MLYRLNVETGYSLGAATYMCRSWKTKIIFLHGLNNIFDTWTIGRLCVPTLFHDLPQEVGYTRRIAWSIRPFALQDLEEYRQSWDFRKWSGPSVDLYANAGKRKNIASERPMAGVQPETFRHKEFRCHKPYNTSRTRGMGACCSFRKPN